MITAYKFLTPQMTSYNNFQWEIGKEYTIDKPGNEMCSKQVFHCYNNPLLAEFMMPLHISFIVDYDLYKIEVPEFVNDDGLKFVSKSQKVIEKIERPIITAEQRTEIAIRVAKLNCKNKNWNEWAYKWLTGEDRTKSSASTATAYAAYDAAYATAYAAYATAYAAYDAAYAADFDAYYVNYVDSNAHYAAYAAKTSVGCFSDKDEFNKKLIEIIEMVCKK